MRFKKNPFKTDYAKREGKKYKPGKVIESLDELVVQEFIIQRTPDGTLRMYHYNFFWNYQLRFALKGIDAGIFYIPELMEEGQV